MTRIPALTIVTTLLLCSWTGQAMAQKAYKPPYPHSTGAQLLPYCQQADVPVELLRCDFYMQGVADLTTTPVKGQRLACIPRGMNRTELLEFALEHLSSQTPEVLEESSAASLILQAMQKGFPCPKQKTRGGKSKMAIDPDAKGEKLKAFQKLVREKQARESGEAGKQ